MNDLIVTPETLALTQAVIGRARTTSCHTTPGGYRSLAQTCDLMHLPLARAHPRADDLYTTRPVKRGQHLIEFGQRLSHLFVVQAGFFKSALLSDGGNEHILAFPMRGDLLGSGGLHSGQYSSAVTALTDSEVIVIPTQDRPGSNSQTSLPDDVLCRAQAAEFVRLGESVGLRSVIGADARLAGFLIAFGQQMATRGFSRHRFQLHMTRQEIGSYLGLQLATVSRAFSALVRRGTISVQRRDVNILDSNALAREATRQLTAPV